MKTFTIEEANETVKLIIPALRRVQRMAETITLLGSVQNSDNELIGTYKMQKELHKIHYEFFNHLDFLDEQGIIIKDPHKGEIEFPCSVNGKQVFLHFKLGQDRVTHWYTDDDTTPRPISLLQ
ncbi:DUF2203 family protein [Candidatus Woesearchaeota archaeon]|nr:MAG: DUF2203 family protein [Candidatus Woesearchaeota archaeon]